MEFQNPGRDIPGNLSPLDVMLAEMSYRYKSAPPTTARPPPATKP